MPDIQRIITITAQGGNSGPYYDVYWSNDCVTYTLATDGDNVYLPSVGSSVYVTMPDTACCIKLINLTPGCELNEVVLNFCPTTTTSTTLSPTTSTTTLTPTTTTTLSPTTTTIAPTTTTTLTPTTTTTQCPCVESVVLSVAEAGNVSFTDCLGVSRLTNVGTGLQTLDYAEDGCIQYLTLAGTADFVINSLGPCCSPVTTTTTTLAPTTTIAPTTTTTQCPCVETITLNVTEAGNVSFTDCLGVSRLTNVGTGLQTLDYATDGCIQINTLSGTATFTIDAYGPCCSPVTTTTIAPTTTTLAPTTTTTTVAPTTTTQPPVLYKVELCGGGLGPFIVTRASGDSPSGIGQAFKISGNSGAGFNGINCWEVLENPTTGTPDYTNLDFGPVFSNCSECNPPTTTTLSPTTTVAPTTTTLAPTTTTTTTPPTIYLVEPCGGGQGPYKITYGTGDLPSGVGQAFKLNNGGTPFNGVDCWEILEYPVAGPADYEAVAFGSVFSNCAACVPTTTTTIAPTTTTLAPTTTTTIAPTTTTTFPPCVTSVSFEVDSAGDVRYVDCCGNTIYLTFSIGPQSITDCMEYGSLFGVGATISFITYNTTPCSCPPTTTTTTIAPTTTTTTIAPTTTTTIAPTTTTTTAAVVDIDITNASLDVPINDMTINGVSVTFVAGGDGFPVVSGENGQFSSTQLGTQDVVIYYGGHIPGQNITFTDSASNVTCQNLTGASGTFTIVGATITGGTFIFVNVTDGACS